MHGSQRSSVWQRQSFPLVCNCAFQILATIALLDRMPVSSSALLHYYLIFSDEAKLGCRICECWCDKKNNYWPKHLGTSKHVLFSDPKRKAAFFYRPKGICQEKFQGTQWIKIAVDWNDLFVLEETRWFSGGVILPVDSPFFWNLCRVGRPSCEKTLSFCWFCSWKMRVIFCLVLGVWNYFLFWGRILLQWFAFIWTILLYCSQCIHVHVLWQCDHHVVIRTLQRSLGDEETPHQQTNIDLSIYFSDDSNLTLHRRPCVEIHGFAAFASLLSLHCCGRDWGELQHAAASTSIGEQWEIQQWSISRGEWLHCRRGVHMHAWWKRKVLQFRVMWRGMRLCFCFAAGGGLMPMLPKSSGKTKGYTVHALHIKQLLLDNSSSHDFSRSEWLHCRRGVQMLAWWKRKLLQFRVMWRGMRLCFCFAAGGGLMPMLPKSSGKTKGYTVHALHIKQLLLDNSSSHDFSRSEWLHCRRGVQMLAWWKRKLLQFRDVSWGMRMCFCCQGGLRLMPMLRKSSDKTSLQTVHALHIKQLLLDNSSSHDFSRIEWLHCRRGVQMLAWWKRKVLQFRVVWRGMRLCFCFAAAGGPMPLLPKSSGKTKGYTVHALHIKQLLLDNSSSHDFSRIEWLHCRRGVQMLAWWKRKVLQFRVVWRGMRLCFCFAAAGGPMPLLPKSSGKTKGYRYTLYTSNSCFSTTPAPTTSPALNGFTAEGGFRCLPDESGRYYSLELCEEECGCAFALLQQVDQCHCCRSPLERLKDIRYTLYTSNSCFSTTPAPTTSPAWIWRWREESTTSLWTVSWAGTAQSSRSSRRLLVPPTPNLPFPVPGMTWVEVPKPLSICSKWTRKLVMLSWCNTPAKRNSPCKRRRFARSTWELQCGMVFPTVQFSMRTVSTTFAMVLAKRLQNLQLNFWRAMDSDKLSVKWYQRIWCTCMGLKEALCDSVNLFHWFATVHSKFWQPLRY